MTETDLPDRIREYYARAVRNPPVAARGTLLEQTGQMRLDVDGAWMPFTAEQHSAATQTRFVWHARFKMAPLVTGVVEDAYEDGRGRLDAKIWGVFPVAHGRGLDVDRGEAQRYLAELPWCPMAITHNPELRFELVSEDCVRVWVHDKHTYVDLYFDSEGDVVRARTTTRVRGDEIQPWEGHFSDYRQFGDLRAPSKGEVSWETPDGPFTYWKGEITSLKWDS